MFENRYSKRYVDLSCSGAEDRTVLDGLLVDGQTQIRKY